MGIFDSGGILHNNNAGAKVGQLSTDGKLQYNGTDWVPMGAPVGSDNYGGYTDPQSYGWGNFTPSAQQTGGFYADMAQYYGQAPAPQLQRTGVDWTGYGIGQQAMPQGPVPTGPPPPSYSPFPPTVRSIEPGTNGIPSFTPLPPAVAPITPGSNGVPLLTPNGSGEQTGTSAQTLTGPAPGGPSFGNTSNLIQPVGGPKFSLPGGAPDPTAPPQGMLAPVSRLGTASPGAQPNLAPLTQPAAPAPFPAPDLRTTSQIGTAGAGPAIAPTKPIMGMPAAAAPQAYAPIPPPPQAGVPSTGQFANPLFQQSQQTRAAEGAVQNKLSNPYMYSTPDQATAGQSRATQGGVLAKTSADDYYATPNQGVQQQGRAAQQGVFNSTLSPDLYKNQDQTIQQQGRTTQQNVLNATTAPGLYNTPDRMTQDQSRAGQQGLVNRLNSDLSGAQPSLAQLQLKQGTDANIAAAQALAASSGPQNAALAQRQAIQQAAAQGQSLSGQSAMLRAQEYAQARGELGQATTNLRGQDLQNLGMSYQNTTNQAQLAAQQAQALRGQDIQNLGMTYQNTTNQAQLQAQQAQAMRGQDIQNLGLDYTNKSNQANVSAQQAASMRNADLQNLGMSYQNTTNQTQMAMQNAQATRAQDLQATGMSYANALAQAQLEAQQNAAQAQLQAGQNSLNAQTQATYYGMANSTMANDEASRMHYMDLMASKYANDKGLAQQAGQFQQQQSNQLIGAGIGAGAAFLGAMSDKRQKTDIEDADHEDISEFLSKLKESTFRYKNEKFGAGEHFGVMAQDVERSRVGRTIVVETPDGKALDMRKALSALLASAAVHEKRLKRVEASQ